MSGDRMTRVSEVLEQALSRAAAERAAFLDEACAADAELRAEVESLIASHELAGTGFLAGRWLPVRPEVAAGRRIGPYLVGERIGYGGMGEVFAAVRADGQYEQKVALKVVRAGYMSAAVVDRFRAERQILAGLEHPNIARLLDGGTTDDGAPYLVMEFVDGSSIDEFCRSRELSIRDRLRLFLQVCSAVQYAHQRAVIHRDIKPGNILVTTDGVPKLLDFGIAKMLDEVGNTQETVFRPFTPEYASPEQVRGEPVSTATDVYSLAVVLYHLLTGRSPYKRTTHTPEELAEAIKNVEPERPAPAALRGDLDFILLKALRKESGQRYASVEQFADDIRRHLDGLPVTARKGSWNYLAGKFARRHRTAVTAAALVLMTLVSGIVVSVREARIAEANRRRADARFNDVRKLANSLMFEVHDSIANLQGATDARKLILQRAVEYLDSLAKEAGDEPDLVRELASGYQRIGSLQSNSFMANIGDVKAAEVSLRKAVELRESLARSNPRSSRDQIELAAAYLRAGEFQSGAGNFALGFSEAKRALAILDHEGETAPDDPRIAKLRMEALMTVGMLQAGNGLLANVGTPMDGIADLQRAIRLLERAMEQSPADDNLRFQVGSNEMMIGEAFLQLGDRVSALAHYRRGLVVLQSVARAGTLAAAVFNVAVSYGKIADVLLIEGKTSEALPFYVLDEQSSSRLAVGDPHNVQVQRQEAIAQVELGHALVELGRVAEGVPHIRRALTIIEADPDDTPLTRSVEALIRGWLGEALERQGRIREASREYALTKEKLGAVRKKGVDHPRVLGYFGAAASRLAAALVKLGDVAGGLREYEETRVLLESVVAKYPRDLEPAYVLAETYTAEGTIAADRASHEKARSEQLSQWTAARDWFRKSLDAWSRIPHPARISTSGFEVTMPQEVARRLADVERQILLLST